MKTHCMHAFGATLLACASLLACSGDDDGDGAGAQQAADKLGTACEASGDCGEALSCRSDTSDYLAHGQCTKDCTSSEECVAAFGDQAMCIGAGICVRVCEADADCPAKTKCNAGWCLRTGPGSGNPYCGGVPTPCSLLQEYDCMLALGCSWSGDCHGVAPSCYSQYSSYACNDIEGCYWSYSSEDCSGSATPCSLLSSYSCASQDGCSWSGTCSGIPSDDCYDLSVSLCGYATGCTVMGPD